MLRLANITATTLWPTGSGDGRSPSSRRKYGAKGVGFEIDPRLVEISWRIANGPGVPIASPCRRRLFEPT
jgi:hypothetical protein